MTPGDIIPDKSANGLLISIVLMPPALLTKLRSLLLFGLARKLIKRRNLVRVRNNSDQLSGGNQDSAATVINMLALSSF